MTSKYEPCAKCGGCIKEPFWDGKQADGFGVTFNPAPDAALIRCNMCRSCITKFAAPAPKTGWSGQFGGSHAHETMSVYEPFTTQEMETFENNDEWID